MESSDFDQVCDGVRRFYFPQTIYIIIGVVSAIVVIVNSLALISVLRNYRRLRQRIYVFVISLAAVEILAGLIFFADIMSLFFLKRNEQSSRDTYDYVIFSSTSSHEQKYVRVQDVGINTISRELMEGFKSAVVILSVLNIALVTFALYKRTTSMGRHHQDFKGIGAGLASDSHSFLPAFDTMLRVLSIGSPIDAYSGNRGFGGRGSQSSCRNADCSPRQSSVTSRQSLTSSPNKSSSETGSGFIKDSGAGLLDRNREQPNARATTPIVRITSDGKGRKTSGQSKHELPKKNQSTRLFSSGRRISHAVRSRSSSASQGYVGRHSYSVMSKPASCCSLVTIWLIFLITCFLPMVLRRSGLTSVICPEACRTVEVTEMIKIYDSMRNDDNKGQEFKHRETSSITQAEPNDSGSEQKLIPEPIKDSTTPTHWDGRKRDVSSYMNDAQNEINKIHGQNEARQSTTPTQDSDSDVFGGKDNASLASRTRFKSLPKKAASRDEIKSNRSPGNVDWNFRSCVPAGFRYYNSYSSSNFSGSNSPGYGIDDPETSSMSSPDCSSCSTAFFPLSKSHMIFNALVILVTWVWMIISASRLLYLRKHSTNVFVRCSALWRFMFMTSVFYLCTLAPYVTWIALDSNTASPASESQLWHTTPPGERSTNYEFQPNQTQSAGIKDSFSNPQSEFSKGTTDVEYLHQVCGVLATFLLLLNFTVSPTLYLVRLLGFRRIMSAL